MMIKEERKERKKERERERREGEAMYIQDTCAIKECDIDCTMPNSNL